jgi:anti-anti-sigma factor
VSNPPDETVLPLTVEVTPRDEVTVLVTVSGEVDLATAAQLQASLIEVVDVHAPGHVVIDAAAMPFLDAAGMTALVDAYRHAAAKHVDIRIENVAPLVRTALTIVDLVGFLNITTPPDG